MAGFWLGAAGLTVVALAFLLLPLWREEQRSGKRSLSGPLAAIAIAPIAVGLYLYVSTFDSEVAPSASQEERALLEQLAGRLSADPNDVDGWVLLGRSYIQLGDYGQARLALEEAWKRTANPDDVLKLAYARTLLFTEEGASLALGGDLVEQVLERAPNNSEALLWGGFVAMDRGQPSLAVERFSTLLASNPPPEIAEMLRSQILSLGGGPAAATAPRAATATPAAAGDGPTITVDVAVADAIDLSVFGPNARLFVLARASDMPAPVAALPVALSALPGRFTLSDANAMIPGRVLSNYPEVTVVARISNSGDAIENSGDAYAEAQVEVGTEEVLSLVIDRIVP